jgi:hypothetical protein
MHQPTQVDIFRSERPSFDGSPDFRRREPWASWCCLANPTNPVGSYDRIFWSSAHHLTFGPRRVLSANIFYILRRHTTFRGRRFACCDQMSRHQRARLGGCVLSLDVHVLFFMNTRLPCKAPSGTLGLSASVLSGISVPRAPNFNCPSGNCTWPEYESLAVCSSCKDVNKQAIRNCSKTIDDGNLYCDYTTSENTTLNAKQQIFYLARVGGTVLNSTMTTSRDVEGRPSFAQFGILRVVTDWYGPWRVTEEAGEPYEEVPLSLYECDLAWCLKKYGPAKVDNGVLAESVPTESTFNTTIVFRSNMQGSGCVSNAHVLSYKTFGGQHLNDS